MSFTFSDIIVREYSSVGLERCLDRAEVGGSNPSTLTYFTWNISFLENLYVISSDQDVPQKTLVI